MQSFSSKVNSPKHEKIESINANHVDMIKCRAKTDSNYRKIKGVLEEFLDTEALKS